MKGGHDAHFHRHMSTDIVSVQLQLLQRLQSTHRVRNCASQ